MLPSEIPKFPTDPPVRGFLGVWDFSSFTTPSLGWVSVLNSLSLFLYFIFCPTSFQRQWAGFLGTWCPLPVLRSCFVEFSQCSNDPSMNLWGQSGLPVLLLHHLRTALSDSFYFKDNSTQEYIKLTYLTEVKWPLLQGRFVDRGTLSSSCLLNYLSCKWAFVCCLCVLKKKWLKARPIIDMIFITKGELYYLFAWYHFQSYSF